MSEFIENSKHPLTKEVEEHFGFKQQPALIPEVVPNEKGGKDYGLLASGVTLSGKMGTLG